MFIKYLWVFYLFIATSHAVEEFKQGEVLLSVQQALRSYVNIQDSQAPCQCLMIEGKDAHRDMIHSVIKCIVPDVVIHEVEDLSNYGQILQKIDQLSQQQGHPLIVNFSGDFASKCRFLIGGNDFFDALSDWREDLFSLNELIDFFQGKTDLLSTALIQKLNPLKNSQNKENDTKNIKEYAVNQEFQEKIDFSQEVQQQFYRHVAQSPGLFIFAMGNRFATSENAVHRIFSPLRASLGNLEFLNTAIFVVNITDQNTLEKNSEIPGNDGRGNHPISSYNTSVSAFISPYLDNFNHFNNPLASLKILYFIIVRKKNKEGKGLNKIH